MKPAPLPQTQQTEEGPSLFSSLLAKPSKLGQAPEPTPPEVKRVAQQVEKILYDDMKNMFYGESEETYYSPERDEHVVRLHEYSVTGGNKRDMQEFMDNVRIDGVRPGQVREYIEYYNRRYGVKLRVYGDSNKGYQSVCPVCRDPSCREYFR